MYGIFNLWTLIFPSVFQPETLTVDSERPGFGFSSAFRVALCPDLGCGMDIQNGYKKRSTSSEYCVLSSCVVWNAYMHFIWPLIFQILKLFLFGYCTTLN
jgi:hypothetical protein